MVIIVRNDGIVVALVIEPIRDPSVHVIVFNAVRTGLDVVEPGDMLWN